MKIKEIKENIKKILEKQREYELKFFMAECEHRNTVELAGKPFNNFYTCFHAEHPAKTSLSYPPCDVKYCPL